MNRLALSEVGCLHHGGRNEVIMGPVKGAGTVKGSLFLRVKVVLKQAG